MRTKLLTIGLLTFTGILAVLLVIQMYMLFRRQVIFLPVREGDMPSRLDTILALIEHRYVDSVSREWLFQQAIYGILERLDPFSIYLEPPEQAEARIALEGQLEGIGIEFTIMRDTPVILTVLPGGPAEMAGLLPGDRILQVDTVVVAGPHAPSTMEIVSLIRGARGTPVSLRIRRPGISQSLTFRIVRDVIAIRSLDAALLFPDGTGYIRLSSFTRSTPEELEEALERLLEQGMERLILDLRGNPGGVFQSAIEVADEFLGGIRLITYTEGRAFPRQEFYTSREGTYEDGPLAVLIDEASASASEIVASALQYHERAILVGRRSFGKAMVQEEFPFPDGSALRLTVAYYYTPDGRKIQRPWRHLRNSEGTSRKDTLWGIDPDVHVPPDTIWHHPFFVRIAGSGWILQFVYSLPEHFFQKIQRQFPGMDIYTEEYHVPDSLWDRFQQYMQEKLPDVSPHWYAVFREEISWLLKANIARHIWGMNGFFYVRLQRDPVFQKARKILQQQDTLPAGRTGPLS